MINFKLLVSSVLLLVLGAAGLAFYNYNLSPAKINGYEISRSNAKIYLDYLRVKNTDATIHQALAELIEAKVFEIVLIKRGFLFSLDERNVQHYRMQNFSKKVPTAKAELNIFNNLSVDLYDELYLKPRWAKSLLKGKVYPWAKDIHREKFRRAKSFASSLEKGSEKFKSKALEYNFIYNRFILNKKTLLVQSKGESKKVFKSSSQMSTNKFPFNHRTKFYISSKLKSFKKSMTSKVIENLRHFEILKLIYIGKNSLLVEQAKLPKITFEEFMLTQRENINIVFKNSEIKNNIQKYLLWQFPTKKND